MEKIDMKYLRQFELFESQNEMDESINQYTAILHEEGFPKSVFDVLRCLGASSLRVLGISWKKQQTIANETNYSRWTVNLALKKLESLGIIDAVRTKTKAGRLSGKVYRIKPFIFSNLHEDLTSSEVDEANGGNELTLVSEFEPIKAETSNSFKTLDKGVDTASKESFDSIDNINPDTMNDFIPDAIVEPDFVKLAKPFFGTRKILSLSRTLKNALNWLNLTLLDPYVFEAVESAFKASIFAYKHNRIKTNLSSYFFGVLSSKLSEASRKIARDRGSNPLYFDWLEA